MKPKGVIILSPPWPRSGTSNIVAAQIAAHLDAGEQVYLLLEPLGPRHSKHARGRWQDAVSGMPFSDRIAVDYPRASRRRFGRRLRFRLGGGSDAITEIANYAASGTLPSSLQSFIDAHDIRTIRINHVFGIELGVELRRKIKKNTGQTVALVLDTHDVQSDTYASGLRRNIVSGEADPREALLAGEIALAKQADALIHISQQDFDFFSAALPASKHFLIPPTLSPEIERELVAGRQQGGDQAFDFVFFGNRHAGNVASIKWLLTKVLPKIETHELDIRIAGTIKPKFKKEEPDLFRRYESFFIGELPTIFPFYRSAKAVLAHSTMGTGASIKLIEALCAGKVTLTSTIGLRGVSSAISFPDDLLSIDDPDHFAAAMVSLASNGSRYSAENAAIYDEHFSNRAYRQALQAIGLFNPISRSKRDDHTNRSRNEMPTGT